MMNLRGKTPEQIMQDVSKRHLALDAQLHEYPDQYTLLYVFLLDDENIDILDPFKIYDLKNAIAESLSKKEAQILEKLFGLNGGHLRAFVKPNPKDIATINMQVKGNEILSKLRSVKSMYMYSPVIRTYVDSLARKVWDPENKYSNVIKANYACLYFTYLTNFHHFPDDNPNMYLDSDLYHIEILNERNMRILPYVVISAYHFFKDFHFPDGDLLIPMIDGFFKDLVSENVKEQIYKYAQITNDVYEPLFISNVRSYKETLFPYGMWKSEVDFFRLSSIKELSIATFGHYLSAYHMFSVKNFVGKIVSTDEVWYSDEIRKIRIFEYANSVQVSDHLELSMYSLLYDFLSKNMPNLPLGKRKIPFSESSTLKKFSM